MPIVMVGPDCATGVRWAKRRRDSVHLLNPASPASWAGELRRLADDEALRGRLSAAALAAGDNDFDPSAIRHRFLKSLAANVAG